MDATKKRRREDGPPLITYEADNRIFDRLFKEHSLNELKSVVRKKLNLAPSLYISLSQVRDGKLVDLEDDDDFEAFRASACAASAVKIKVKVGEAQALLNAGQTEVPLSSSKRKRKKKQKSSQDSSPALSRESSKDATPLENSVEAARLSKRRRVSFVETLPNSLLKYTKAPADKSTKPIVGDSNTVSQPESMGNSGDLSGQVTDLAPPSVESKKMKKKRLEESSLNVGGTQAEGEATRRSTAQPTIAQPPNEPHDSTHSSKSRKRRLKSIAAEIEDGMSAEYSSKDSSLNYQGPKSESEKPSKKSKTKHGNQGDSEREPDPAEPSDVRKPTPKAQPDSMVSGNATVKPREETTKRNGRLKEIPSLYIAESIKTPPTVAKSFPKKVDRIGGTKTSNKSTIEMSGPEALSSEHVEASDKTKERKKSKKGSRVPAAEDQFRLAGVPSTMPNPDRTASELQKNNINSTTAASADVKTPDESKRRKDAASVANMVKDDLPTENAKKQGVSISQIDRQEVTRLAIEAILSRKAARAKGTQELQASDVAEQVVCPPVQHIIQNSNIQSQVDKSPLIMAAPAQEKLEASAKCLICGESSIHARTKCPTIKAGIRAMRKRIAELQAETSEDVKEERSKLISELQTYIDKKSRKSRNSELATDPNSVLPAVNKVVEQSLNEAQTSSKTTPGTPSTEIIDPPSVLPKLANPSAVSQLKPSTEPTHITQLPANPDSESSSLAVPPTVACPPVSQSSIRRPVFGRASISRKDPEVLQASDSFRAPVIISAGPLRPDFLGLGDISAYTDKDLEDIIRGPKVSVKDFPESDSEVESEQEPEATLEEDDALETKARFNGSRVEYPTSSDEGDEDENEGSPAGSVIPEPVTSSTTTTKHGLDRSLSSDTEEMQVGEMSFHDLETNGSPVELDRTGDLAVNEVIEADLAQLKSQNPESLQSTPRNVGMEADSDDAIIASQTEDHVEERGASAEKQLATMLPPPFPSAEKPDLDPIELSEPIDPSFQLEPIASDDNNPMQSSPKALVNSRSRRQNAKVESNRLDHEAQPVQSTPSLNKTTEAGESLKSARVGKGLVKISELPIPPNPSIRIIRPAHAPKTRRQTAQETQERGHDTDKTTEESNPRMTRSATASKASASKTPAKTPTKAIAKGPAKFQRKTSASNVAINTRSRSRTTVPPVNDDSKQPSQTTNATLADSQGTVASWEVLQESGHFQTDTETPPMVDELLPSPVLVSTGTRGQKDQRANAAEEPLFFPADSQQSFPYSQYPDLRHHQQKIVSPNESDDEEEVAAAVRRPAASGRQSTMFRGLSEIASQPTLFVSRLSQQFTKAVKEPVENLYGRTSLDSEESESGSDSEAETKAAASHIPASRRAGVSVRKKV